MMTMVRTFLGLGTNIGDRVANLVRAGELLAGVMPELGPESPVYVSRPWGFDSEHDFLNRVIEVRTGVDAFDLLDIVQDIEKKMGRLRKLKEYTDRIIDIDILFYGGEIISSKPLVVPHPLLHKRMFVLQPMADIAPGFVHPVLNKTIAELMSECDDPPLEKFSL